MADSLRSRSPRSSWAVGPAVSVALLAGLLGCAAGSSVRAGASAAAPASPSASAPSASGPAALATTGGRPAAKPRPRPKPQPEPKPKPAPIALPPAGARFDYQLGGAYPLPAGVTVVVRDRAAAPAARAYNVCYVNAFQTQPQELAWWRARHPKVLLTGPTGYVSDPDWPGEVLLDTSTAAKRAEILAAVGPWIDACAAKGFKAVEPDNLDSWTRSGGRLTSASAMAMARLLTARAHARRLAIAQKNAAEIAPSGRALGFDFAVAEECQAYRECDTYVKTYGARVLEVEYTDGGEAAFAQACAGRTRRNPVVLRDRDLVARGADGYAYRSC